VASSSGVSPDFAAVRAAEQHFALRLVHGELLEQRVRRCLDLLRELGAPRCGEQERRQARARVGAALVGREHGLVLPVVHRILRDRFHRGCGVILGLHVGFLLRFSVGDIAYAPVTVIVAQAA